MRYAFILLPRSLVVSLTSSKRPVSHVMYCFADQYLEPGSLPQADRPWWQATYSVIMAATLTSGYAFDQ